MDLLTFRTWTEIDLDALIHNHGVARKNLPDGVKSCLVVKADAYGHGAVRTARLFEGHCDYFAVAMVEEAYELRRAGIKTPILVLGVVPEGHYEGAIKQDVTLTLTCKEDGARLNAVAKRLSKKAKVHIALDTGMGRIGFLPCDDTLEELEALCHEEFLQVEGIFTHFACADQEENDFSRRQQECFARFIEALEARGVLIPLKHLYNSAAICTMDQPEGMVREGLILYGISPLEQDLESLLPAMTMKSRIIQVKTLPAGCPISYGSTYRTTKETLVATVAAGYGDGVPRALSNKGRVYVHGAYAPIIGRICMDQFMIDVTHIPGVQSGEEVELFGRAIGAREVMDLCGGIAYELLCGVNKRVPRVYMKDGKIESIATILPEYEDLKEND
ncbi:MAG: alanine racemase [Clostridia bacterium]|nr:alanine racemase [Clostridia bacterium]